MEIIRGIPSGEMQLAYPILAVGNFDGVHLGHQAILRQVVQRAREVRGTALALTFDPHPVKVLAPDRPMVLLTSLPQKVRLIEALGLGRLICLPFTLDFSEQKPAEFIENVLHLGIRAREVYVGRNFAFGHGREGTAEDLQRIGRSLGMEVSIIEPVLVGGTVVSSSRIRKLLLEGQVAAAAGLLGRAYEIEGIVVGGDRRGRLLGFPTANLQPPEELVPKAGVYAVKVIKGSGQDQPGPLSAIAYIGTRPTFTSNRQGKAPSILSTSTSNRREEGPSIINTSRQNNQTIEVHLFKYEGDLYQERLCVSFLERVRDEMVFSGPEELALQIKKDVDKAHAIHEKIARTGKSGTRPPD